MHDQKFEKIFRPRPEDGLYGSNEPKKCEIHPVVSSIVHFKVFKSYFIYIIDLRHIKTSTTTTDYSQTCSRPIPSLPGLQGQKPKAYYYFTF